MGAAELGTSEKEGADVGGHTITRWLESWRRGDEHAAGVLFSLVYPELRKIAHGYLKIERIDHTFQPSDLVHEAYLRLVDQRSAPWRNRSHFFAIAAKMIRRILIDHARRVGAEKRGGGTERVTLAKAAELPILETPEQWLLLNDALLLLRKLDPLQETIVEYRFFGGLTGVETARVLGRSPETVKRQWRLAKAWLYREMTRR